MLLVLGLPDDTLRTVFSFLGARTLLSLEGASPVVGPLLWDSLHAQAIWRRSLEQKTTGAGRTAKILCVRVERFSDVRRAGGPALLRRIFHAVLFGCATADLVVRLVCGGEATAAATADCRAALKHLHQHVLAPTAPGAIVRCANAHVAAAVTDLYCSSRTCARHPPVVLPDTLPAPVGLLLEDKFDMALTDETAKVEAEPWRSMLRCVEGREVIVWWEGGRHVRQGNTIGPLLDSEPTTLAFAFNMNGENYAEDSRFDRKIKLASRQIGLWADGYDWQGAGWDWAFEGCCVDEVVDEEGKACVLGLAIDGETKSSGGGDAAVNTCGGECARETARDDAKAEGTGKSALSCACDLRTGTSARVIALFGLADFPVDDWAHSSTSLEKVVKAMIERTLEATKCATSTGSRSVDQQCVGRLEDAMEEILKTATDTSASGDTALTMGAILDERGTASLLTSDTALTTEMQEAALDQFTRDLAIPGASIRGVTGGV